MVLMRKTKLSFMLLTIAAFAGACSKMDDSVTPASKSGTFYGEQKAVGSGTAWTYASIDNNGNPTSVGIILTSAALNALPKDSLGAEYVLALPPQASGTPFNHITLNWNSFGHEPTKIYGLPHFDFHFYMISQLNHQMIAGGPDTFTLPAKYIPAGYSPLKPAMAVPMMGVHYFDTSAAEWHGIPFTKTFIYGYYQGQMIFFEPMITKALIMTKQTITDNIRQPGSYPIKGKYYPTTYTMRYDATVDEYFLSLDGLMLRE